MSIETLRRKLGSKERRVGLRYDYYDMKQAMQRISALIPKEFRALTYALGWCAKALDTLSDRIVFDGFDGDKEIASCDQLNRLYDALAKAGFSAGEIEKIACGNVMRVIHEAMH